MSTILNDKKHKDNHFLALFLNGIVMLGEQAVEQAIAHLIESKGGIAKPADLSPYQICLQQHAGECGVCDKVTGAFTPCA